VTPAHVPVMPDECLRLLAPEPGMTAIDATCGAGGHAAPMAEAVGGAGTLVLNDLDPASLKAATERVGALADPPRVVAIRGSFAELPGKLAAEGIAGDCLLADLGFSSAQVDDPARGLSFRFQGPLDMRLDPDQRTTAAELVNSLPEAELGEIIRDFGEERAWRAVARKIVEARRETPISTTTELARLVRAVVRVPRESRIDPATRTFQALRIAVNDELGALEALLEAVRRTAAGAGATSPWLRPGARVVILTFHSLEDRPVKRAFRDLTSRGLAENLTRSPIAASDAEVSRNPRARSAKLRAVRLRS